MEFPWIHIARMSRWEFKNSLSWKRDLWKRHGWRDFLVKEEGRKKEEEERGKRGKESNQGALATRNPMLLLVRSGEKKKRDEERTPPVLLPQEPPRNTRGVPDTGPSGFVDGLTE